MRFKLVSHVLLAATAFVLTLASTQVDDVPSGSEVPGRYCHVPGVSAELERALCDADTIVLFNTLSEMSQAEETLPRAVRILEQLWLSDSTLGDGLNWKLLGREDARAHVVMQLALAIRDGQSNIPIQPLQNFATSYAQKYMPDGVTYGLALIGYTDAPGQLPLLSKAVQSSDRMARRSAISALGSMCSADTKLFLAKLASDLGGLDAEDRKRAAAHLKRRESKKGALWCAHAAPLPGRKSGEI